MDHSIKILEIELKKLNKESENINDPDTDEYWDYHNKLFSFQDAIKFLKKENKRLKKINKEETIKIDKEIAENKEFQEFIKKIK